MLQPLKCSEFIGLIIPASVSILFMVVSIFLYRNYPMQKFFTALSAISLLATIGIVIYAVVNPYRKKSIFSKMVLVQLEVSM